MIRRLVTAVVVAGVAFAVTPRPVQADDSLQALLERAGRQAASYVEVLSSMNSREHVTQLKLNEAGKPVDRRESDFDYLVLFNNSSAALTLTESRLPVADATQKKKEAPPLLLSNGFSLLFLVFHPYYAASFEYTLGDTAAEAGRQVIAIRFRHIRGTRSPAALAIRGREYQLDLAGTAFVDPSSGTIVKITAGLDTDMSDIGLQRLTTTIDYAPVGVQAQTYWLPSLVTVEVESRHQHWRNTHQFSSYKRFGVDTTEQVKTR